MIDYQRAFCDAWEEKTGGKPIPGRGIGMVKLLEKHTGISDSKKSRWAQALLDEVAYALEIRTKAERAANLAVANNHRAKGTGDNEWFTPIEYIDAARAVIRSTSRPAAYRLAICPRGEAGTWRSPGRGHLYKRKSLGLPRRHKNLS
jgi:hypothetical protein